MFSDASKRLVNFFLILFLLGIHLTETRKRKLNNLKWQADLLF